MYSPTDVVGVPIGMTVSSDKSEMVQLSLRAPNLLLGFEQTFTYGRNQPQRRVVLMLLT